jgi:ribose transport system permease protein
MSENAQPGFTESLRRRIDPPVAIAFGCILLMLFLGSLYSRSFLSPEYLLQQLKVASFLGVIATGTMIVILLGQIDLSIPWVVAVGGMMSTAATGWGPVGHVIAIPFGIACGVALGLVNGFGVAYLRIPSMIITLAVNAVAQGLMVVHTGGFSPQDSSSPAMRTLATGELFFGLPNALIVWAVVGAGAIFLLSRTTFGRAVYGIGNRERAAYLSGINTQRVVLIAFALAGGLSAFGGVLLAGYASKAAQAMGDAYLLPAIAAVVLGGA